MRGIVFVLAMVATSATFAQVPPAAGGGRGAGAAVLRLSNEAVAELLALGVDNDHSYLGLHKYDGDSELLSISSSRQLIAFSSGQADSKGGRYVPPASMRADIIMITCGDADLGDRWDCANVTVSKAFRRVAPLTYSGGGSHLPKRHRRDMDGPRDYCHIPHGRS
jgi:hypothetical protein